MSNSSKFNYYQTVKMSDNQQAHYIIDHLPQNKSDISSIPEQKEIVKDKDGEKANDAFRIAKSAGYVATPVITGMGLTMMFTAGNDQFGISHVIRLLGVPVAIGGIVIDTIKFPFAGTVSVGALIWGFLLKLKSLITKENPDIKQTKEIMNSFAHRFANTIQLLVALKLETPESINEKFQNFLKKNDSQGLEALCALTALNTAYASRALSSKSIILANGKVLHKKYCPSKGREIFDCVVKVRDLLRKLNFHKKSNREVTPVIIKWVPIIKECLQSKDISTKEHLMTSLSQPPNEFPSMEDFEMIDQIVYHLKNIGKNAIHEKPLKANATYIQQNSLHLIPSHLVPSTQTVQETNVSDTSACILLDHQTKQILSDAVVGSDGYLYNKSVAVNLLRQRRISRYIEFYSASGPTYPLAEHEELQLDPITCNNIEYPVVANDGRVYDRATAIYMINSKSIGVGGIVLENYIECPNMNLWERN